MKERLRRLFSPGWIVTLALTVLSIALLAVDLQKDRQKTALDYGAYLLSAYTLTALCMQGTRLIPRMRALFSRAQTLSTGHAGADRLLRSLTRYEDRSALLLRASLALNLIYATFKLGCGVYYRSFWLAALGVYYAVLAALRFSLMRSMNQPSEDQGRTAYRRTAWQLNMLTLVMSGVFVQMVIKNRAFQYAGMLIYAMALFAFVKMISAVVNLIRRRREENKALAAARCLSFAEALMSMLALQTALTSQFGDGAGEFARTMNAIGGAVVTALLITLSALMIARSAAAPQAQKNASH